METNTRVFADGFFFKKPREGAPEFVKGNLGVKVDEAVAFLLKHKKEDGFVSLDLLKSKDGSKLYFTLNDWKPEVKPSAQEQSAYPQPEGDVPF